jgi:hypothetical protein
MHEQGRHLQCRQMLHPKLVRLARRMQRIRKEQQPSHKIRLGSAQHRALPPPVRVSSQKDPPAAQFPQNCNRSSEPIPIPCSVPRPRGTIRPILPIGKIATKHSKSGPSERSSHRYQERRIGIRSGAMCQHQPVTSAVFRTMKESAHRRAQPIIAKGLVGICHAPGTAETGNCELTTRTRSWELNLSAIDATTGALHFIANRSSVGGERATSRASCGVFAGGFRAPPRA